MQVAYSNERVKIVIVALEVVEHLIKLMYLNDFCILGLAECTNYKFLWINASAK